MRRALPTLLTILLATEISLAAGPLPAFPPALPGEVAELLVAKTSRLRSTNPERRNAGMVADKAPASLEVILITCDFADSLMYGRHGLVPGSFPAPRQTDRYYVAHDSVFFDHMLQDVASYFADVSGGALTIHHTVHPRTVNLPHPMAWYGNDPVLGDQPILLAAAVIDSLDEEIDFTRYDTVVLVHAGAGEETDILGDSPEQIYSTYLSPSDFRSAHEDSVLAWPYLPAAGFLPGTGIDRVLVLPETEQQDAFGQFSGGFGSLGVYCFEFGLHLGMLSLSDFTPSGRPDSQGVGQYDLMGYGLFVGLGFIPPQPGPFNKLLMGWLSPYDADPALGADWQLTSAAEVSSPLACARVDINGREYWLAEYRLQDANGDRRYSFPGDLNGNGVPDFWDMDSLNGDGTPTGFFDPETDTHENLRGAEWDFAMSENAARQIGELGAGSGVYIWHIDEGVIESVFDSPRNLFNADPHHKAVDLEEADGVQDLDSREPSAWQLGGDDDAFRGEGAGTFGPGTRPDTRSNAGLYTGIVMRDFSNVVLDSAAYEVEVGSFVYPGYDYADTMSFRLEISTAEPTRRLPAVRRELPDGVDLGGSHLLLVDLGGPGGMDEIVAAGNDGRLWILDAALNEFVDHDGNPATVAPFSVGRRGGLPVVWNLPAAVGDIDGDAEPEIILTGPDGLYAFEADGTSVRDFEAGAIGLYANLRACSLPPVLVPVDTSAPRGDPTARVSAVVAVSESGACSLEFYGGADGSREFEIPLGSGFVASMPQLFGDWLLVAVADTVADNGRIVVIDMSPLATPASPLVVEIPLRAVPGPLPVVAERVPGRIDQALQTAVMVVSVEGRGETVVLDDRRQPVVDSYIWPADVVVTGPLGPGGTLLSAGRVGRIGQTGDWLAGWPRRPQPSVASGASVALVARLLDAQGGLDHYLFAAADGRLLARGARGEEVPGWPLPGPGTSAGTPALGSLGGGPDLDLVSVGSFARITGNADGGASLRTAVRTEFAVWHDVAEPSPLWPMWGGSAWRSGAYDIDGFVGVLPVGSGHGLVAGSHICFPNPMTGAKLTVRAQVRSGARVQAIVYDLSGENVASSEWRRVPAVEPFTLEVDLSGTASGMYLCRLVVQSDSGESDVSVVTFAVVH